MTPESPHCKPGLLVLHGNRLEDLADALFTWLRRHPLGPLEEETLLVPSNGMAEWVKMTLATAQGVSAATRVELPARFFWRACRAVLGRDAVPALLPLDKLPLTWRLMSLLPSCVAEDATQGTGGPLAELLRDGGMWRRLQLAQRIADQFDQYQVYRADWLDDWSAGRDRLRPAAGGLGAPALAIPQDQRWQPVLWRALLQELAPALRACTRPALHRRLLDALQTHVSETSGAGRRWSALPRRVVLFGTTQLPLQILEVLAALAAHAQVIIAVPNPCRYHWADIIDGRERLAFERRRQPLRGDRSLAGEPLQAMHAFGHPLLAAWGRQARDFVRQLDAFDDARRSLRQFDIPRIDLFDGGGGETLLQQLQARIRDLVPLAEQRERGETRPPLHDRSIVFHVAHSAQREVEILHDQLLQLLAHPPPGGALQPRDIVVMVPDIEVFAPAIRAVFGQYARGDARYIPWGLADLRERGQRPLLKALEWLLRADEHRFSVSEVRDLLELPAIAGRFGLSPGALPHLFDWIAQAGVRWGLDAGHRAAIGLDRCGEVNTWRFGLRRMLLGYAAGELPDGFEGIEPLAEVAGLEAPLAGALAEIVEVLAQWWDDARAPRTPARWGERARLLLQAVFAPQDEAERSLLVAAGDALAQWLRVCEAAGFDEAVDLAVLREAWLGALTEAGQAPRFKAGGVTFCTLLPMRAIPFDVVCLLGMNEGAYPRAAPPGEFDLMALPGLARPGDRSRRDDDRQLMLDALLSARRVLYLSWAGRSQRDNSQQPPSVLVAQLRDYLDLAWGDRVSEQRTTEHPLQPFSRRYFEAHPQPAGGGLFTYVHEWRDAHVEAAPAAAASPLTAALRADDTGLRLTLAELAAFVRQPVKAFFRHRLKVVFDADDLAAEPDDESFATHPLERSRWVERIVSGVPPSTPRQVLRRLAREGSLPLAGPGRSVSEDLLQTTAPMLAWRDAARRLHALDRAPVHVRLVAADGIACTLEDTLDGLWTDASGNPGSIALVWLASSLFAGTGRIEPGRLKADKLMAAWLRALAGAAAGVPVRCVVVATDASATLEPLDAEEARRTLQQLLATVGRSLLTPRPLATAARTGLAWLADPARPQRAAGIYDGNGDFGGRAEREEPCLARAFPSFEQLWADPHFEGDTRALYGCFHDGLERKLWRFEALPDVVGASAAAVAPADGITDD